MPVVLALAVAATAACSAADTEEQPPTGSNASSGSWTVIFEDEFDGAELDAEKWSDSEPWESEGYEKWAAWYPSPHGADQIEVDQGIATLKARRVQSHPSGKPFTSGHINTRGSFSISEGATSYTEARLRATSAAGTLPAFWLLGNGSNDTGDGWPINGEVDILEFANNVDEAARPYFSVWYPADVYSNPPGSFLNGRHDTHPETFTARPELLDSWHTWGLLRSPDRMELYINDELQATFRQGEAYGDDGLPLPEMLFTAAQHVRLSVMVGGEWAGAGRSESEYEEGDLSVDHVRVWELR